MFASELLLVKYHHDVMHFESKPRQKRYGHEKIKCVNFPCVYVSNDVRECLRCPSRQSTAEADDMLVVGDVTLLER